MAREVQERNTDLPSPSAQEAFSIDLTDASLIRGHQPRQSSEPVPDSLLISPLVSDKALDQPTFTNSVTAPVERLQSGKTNETIQSSSIDFASFGDIYPKEQPMLLAKETREGFPSNRAGQMNFDYQDLQVVSRVYEQAMSDMNNRGMRMQGGEAASLVGNFMANTGLDNRKLVCAEQADFLKARLMANPELKGCSVNYCFTNNYEHAFIQMTDAKGNSLYLDPWAEKGPQSYPPYPVWKRTNPDRI